MHLQLSDNILQKAQANRADLRLAIAIQFYADNRLDHADACRLAGVPTAGFNRELLHRGISIQQYPAARRHRSAS